MSSQAEIGEARAPAGGGTPGSSSRGSWARDHVDTLVGFGLVVIAIACAVFDRHPPVRRFFTVDDSWSLDLFFKAHQGMWVGKDFAFSYGPLYQWLLGISAWGHGVSLGTFFRFGHLGLFAYTTGMVWLSAGLLLRQEPSWKRALLIVGFAIPWTYFEVREATIVLLFALMLQLFEGIADSRSHYAWPAAGGSAAIAFSFLISGDTGIYGIIALLTVAASSCACRLSDAAAVRRILRLAALMCAGLACWCALIGVFMGIQFWRDTLALAGTYRWAMATPFMPPDEKWNLVLVVGICFGVFAAAGRGRKDKCCSLAARPAFQLAAPLFSLACLQSSLVRSDWYHVFFGWFAALALAAFSLVAARNSSSLLSTLRLAGGVALLVVYIYPPATFLPGVIASALAPSSRQVTGCPGGTRLLDGLCVGNSTYPGMQAVASALQAESTAADSVVIFPDENIFGDLARRRVAGGVLQNYAAAGNVLVNRQLQGLQEQKPALAVYSTDQQSGMVSGIPNLTRSPEVWLYLQSHYSAADEVQPGLLILRRDDSRQLRWTAQSLPLAFHPVPQQKTLDGQKVFEIAERISWPHNADLIRMRVLLRYPPWWNLGKPSSLTVLIGRSDGTVKRVRAIAPPNRESDIWVYPGDDEQLGAYFSADANSWRTGPEAPVQSISLLVESMGWFSVQPTAISIEKVEAVKLRLADQQGQP